MSVVDSVLDPASGTFGVRLELANADQSIPAGIRCRVDFAKVRLAPARSGTGVGVSPAAFVNGAPMVR